MRYNDMPISEVTPIKFLYGTLYSCAGHVCHYLVRLEPFASWLIDFQSGKFDEPDRMFHSIAATFNSCFNNSGDVKELVPEFFYNPQMFKNPSHFDFGLR